MTPSAEKSATPEPNPSATEAHAIPKNDAEPTRPWRRYAALGAGALLAALTAHYAPSELLHHLTVFTLACFIGYMVIWGVAPSLHTPLVSLTNAISSIIVIGAIVQMATGLTGITLLATVTIFIASINIAGGFAVTQRMLAMFRK